MCMRMCMCVCMGKCRALALWPLHVCTLMTLLCHIGLQQLLHAHTGCSLSHLWLQPQSHKDAALFTYGQSLNHLGLQPQSRRTTASVAQGDCLYHIGLQPQSGRVTGQGGVVG